MCLLLLSFERGHLDPIVESRLHTLKQLLPSIVPLYKYVVLHHLLRHLLHCVHLHSAQLDQHRSLTEFAQCQLDWSKCKEDVLRLKKRKRENNKSINQIMGETNISDLGGIG